MGAAGSFEGLRLDCDVFVCCSLEEKWVEVRVRHIGFACLIGGIY